MANTILVVCEHDAGAFKSTAFELVGKVQALGVGDVVGVVFGDADSSLLRPLAFGSIGDVNLDGATDFAVDGRNVFEVRLGASDPAPAHESRTGAAGA